MICYIDFQIWLSLIHKEYIQSFILISFLYNKLKLLLISLRHKDITVKKTTLTVITHLVLNDMIKVIIFINFQK